MLRRASCRAIGLAAAGLLLGSAAAFGPPALAGTDPEDPDWPCIQRKVPTISAATMWAGPPIDEQAESWRDDQVIAALAGRISARRTPLADAKAEIDAFASGLGADKDRMLTLLFAAALANVNRERASIIDGIGRYTRRQTALADLIARQTEEINRLAAEGGEDDRQRLVELQEKQLWDTRIYEEREGALTYICEQPVILEQRIFALAREIMMYLD